MARKPRPPEPLGHRNMRERWYHLGGTRVSRVVMMTVGTLCCIIAPILGPIPGPWSIMLFGFGFGLLLKASLWVKKRFVRFKKKYPKSGAWVDWGLRRGSYIRRKERDGAVAKEQTPTSG